MAEAWLESGFVRVGLEALNAVFLLLVLLPVVVLALAARRERGELRRRLTSAAVTAVVPVALITLCVLVSVVAAYGDVGQDAMVTVLLIGMCIAVPLTGYGYVRAAEEPLSLSSAEVARIARVVLTGTSSLVAVGVLLVILQAVDTVAALWVAVLAVAGLGAVLAAQHRVTRSLIVPDDASGGLQATVQPLDALTPRENEVLLLLAEGLSNAGIAERLVLSERTVDAHTRSIFRKLDLPSSEADNRRVQAVLALLQQPKVAS